VLSISAFSALATPRNFPPGTLFGSMSAGADYSQIVINGVVQQLAPGVKIKDRKNRIIMASSLMNNVYLVNYTIDNLGMIDKVWILTDEELALITQ
jgi:hypothetical protein